MGRAHQSFLEARAESEVPTTVIGSLHTDHTCPSQALGGIARNGPCLTQQPSIELRRGNIFATMAYKFEGALLLTPQRRCFEYEVLRFSLGTEPPQSRPRWNLVLRNRRIQRRGALSLSGYSFLLRHMS